MKSRYIFILGPTAIGKHKIAFFLAKLLNGEIISVDSMKVYREMDIGTAKPSKKMREEIKHHLIDIVDPSSSYNAARFVKDAKMAIGEVQTAGKLPIFVGGTGLYYRVFAYGIFDGISRDEKIRRELLEEVGKKGVEYLHQKLSEVDPVSAKKISPRDLRRVVRALEVSRKMGVPISSLKVHFEREPEEKNFLICLRCDREILKNRIDRRVEKMFGDGFVDEVSGLLARKNGWSEEARMGIGYKEVIGYLKGKANLEETKRVIKMDTMHLVKKQMTWFRSFKEAVWLDVEGGEGEEGFQEIAKRILDLYNRSFFS